MPRSKGGSLEILEPKGREILEKNMTPGETVVFCLTGANKKMMLVALNDRAIIIKYGFAAGATFGARVTSFPYSEITGVEVQSNKLTGGYLEIQTASFQGSQNRKGAHEAATAANRLPINATKFDEAQPFVNELRRLVIEARSPSSASPQVSMGDELQKLASLRDSGAISPQDYERAKEKLLS